METVAVTIRPARSEDAQAICDIYNEGIEDGDATLETRLRTGDEQRTWLAARSERHPVVVAERGGAIVGWGSLNAFNPRPAYDHVTEFSVYVARSARGSGVGRVVLEELVVIAGVIGYHKMVLAAFLWNAPGMALYERVGFRRVGVYREQGLLEGKWVDTVIMEKLL